MAATGVRRVSEAKVTKSFRIPVPLLKKLGHASVDLQRSPSTIVRDALERYIPEALEAARESR